MSSQRLPHALLTLALLAAIGDAAAGALREQVERAAQQNFAEYLDALRIPNVPAQAADIQRAPCCIQSAVVDVGGRLPTDREAAWVIGLALPQALAHAAPDLPRDLRAAFPLWHSEPPARCQLRRAPTMPRRASPSLPHVHHKMRSRV